MVTSKKTPYYGFFLVSVAFLVFNQPAYTANFDALDSAQSNFDNLEHNTAPSSRPVGETSILNSLQQSEADNKKNRYFGTLNLLKNHKFDDAQHNISEMLQQSPNEPQFYNLQALLETLKKNTGAAQKNYQKALTLDKNNVASHLGQAKLALDAGDFDTARDHATKALATNDKLVSAYLLLADVAYKQKNYTEVESILLAGYDKSKADIGQETPFINILGEFYGSQKQLEKLLPLAENLVKRYVDNTQALAVLANAQIANTQYDLAEQTLQHIIDKNKRDIDHRLLLVKLISNSPNKEKQVLQLLDETAKIDPNNPQASVYKAAYLIKLKRNQEALSIANSLENQFPKLAIGSLLKGDVHLANRDLDKALNNYQRAYKIEANNAVLLKITDILQSEGKSVAAIALLNAESTKDNKNIAIHFKLATLYQQQHDEDKAQFHYEAILNEQTDNALALNNLAWLYAQKNNPKSLELAKKAYDIAPDNAAITDTYGYILLKQGQAKAALPLLERAAAAAPKDNDIQFHLAEAYVTNDNKQKAIDILETIVKPEQTFSKKESAETLLDQLKTQ